jgi:inhibitor of KinA
MNAESHRIFPLGTDALTIDFGNEISTLLNEKAVNLARYFQLNPFEGLRDVVPAYASVTIFYDVSAVKKYFSNYRTAFAAISVLVENALQVPHEKSRISPRSIEIPVDFGDQFALDLEFVAARNNLTKTEVIEIFTRDTYRVFMLGFMPAFAYMGEVSERIAAPRKSSPRLLVPRGSVGIAGRQTGIYPFESPGGWQIIGKTDFELFTPQAETPCALQAGDLVKFYESSELLNKSRRNHA